jgi:hypothetical protein
MAQYNLAAKILLIEDRGRFVDTKAKNLDRFVAEGVTEDTRTFEAGARRASKVLRVMEKIFREKDPILRSTGGIPVYYWLTRNEVSHRSLIRPFLESFLKRLRANFELTKEYPRRGDPELNQYYTRSRTTNDQASLADRYHILEKHFKKFVRTEARK